MNKLNERSRIFQFTLVKIQKPRLPIDPPAADIFRLRTEAGAETRVETEAETRVEAAVKVGAKYPLLISDRRTIRSEGSQAERTSPSFATALLAFR